MSINLFCCYSDSVFRLGIRIIDLLPSKVDSADGIWKVLKTLRDVIGCRVDECMHRRCVNCAISISQKNIPIDKKNLPVLSSQHVKANNFPPNFHRTSRFPLKTLHCTIASLTQLSDVHFVRSLSHDNRLKLIFLFGNNYIQQERGVRKESCRGAQRSSEQQPSNKLRFSTKLLELSSQQTASNIENSVKRENSARRIRAQVEVATRAVFKSNLPLK